MRGVGRGYPEGIAIVEAALILEANMKRCFDRLLVVTCSPEQRVERWAKRRNVDLESARREVERRMAAQLPEEKKIEAADYLINNSGSREDTEKQVRKVFREMQKDAKKTF